MAIRVAERIAKMKETETAGGLHIREFETPGRKPSGYVTGFLFDHKLNKRTDVEFGSNIIVDSASVLLARLLKDNVEPLNGAAYMALGTGNPSWDLQNVPPATSLTSVLESELIRKQFTVTNFVTATGAISTTPTNILDLSTTFTESEAVGPLTELSVIGGDATATANTGTLINYKTFNVINKNNTSSLSITVRLTL